MKSKKNKSSTYLKTGNGILLIAWLLLGLMDDPGGLEGYGVALFTMLILIIAIPSALICVLVALIKGERPLWAYATILVLAVIPVLALL